MVSGLFLKGSKIALGQWIPGEGAVMAASSGFRGKIDEVRFWNRLLSGAEIKVSWRFNVQRTAKYLAILWKLNQGEGTVVIDVVSRVHLYIQIVNNAVQWVYSGAPVKILSVSASIKFANVHFHSAASKWCLEYIIKSPLGRACQGLGTGASGISRTHTIYYRSCLAISAISGDVTAGLEIVVAFSDLCQVSLGLATWPAQTICNYPALVNSPQMPWFGSQCKSLCIFGKRTAQNDRCRCLAGFFGSSCSAVCPGGILRYCNGNGACSATLGRCSCRYNWRGVSCARCRRGYYGVDCSLNFASVITTGTIVFVSLSGNGHFAGLGGAAWVYRGAAEFNALVSRRLGLAVQLRQVPYGTGVRLRCVIVQSAGSVLAIHSGVGTGVTVTLNGVPIDFTQRTSFGFGITFKRISRTKLLVVGPEGFALLLYHRAVYFEVQIGMNRSLCRDSCGLFGNCGEANTSRPSCPSGGLLQRYNKSKIRQEDIDVFMKSWIIPGNQSKFVDVLNVAKETPVFTAGGTCLYFSRTAIITPAFVNVFHGNYATVQFYLKVKNPLATGGTIFSFALNNSFALRINGTLRIHVGLSVYDTRIFADPNKWNHISIVYHRITGILEFFYRNTAGILQIRVIHVGVGVFESGGRLALGLWQATVGVPTDILGFSGWIDELVVWNKRFDAALINNYNGLSVLSFAPGLAALWKFNEGTGFVANDLVGSLHFRLPTAPWRSPNWEPSDVNITLEVGAEVARASDNETAAFCDKIYNSKSLNDSCGSVEARKPFFYQACLEDVASAGSEDASKGSALAFARECQLQNNLSRLPGQQLCGVFTGQRFDDVSCDTVCLFGVFKSNSCRCDPGYWSTNCSQECPGGASNPCNGHGLCNEASGTCSCEETWKGDGGRCVSCTKGWLGPECAVAIIKSVTKRVAVSIVGPGGVVIGLDGSVFYLRIIGEFFLVISSEVEVQARQIPCRGSHFCINAIAVTTLSVNISIHAPYFLGEDPVITVNEKPFNLNNIGRISFVGVTLSTPGVNEFVVKYDNKLAVRVIIKGQYLIPEVIPSASFCYRLGGLLGSCRNSSGLLNGSVSTFANKTTIPTLLSLINATNINRAVLETFGVHLRSRRQIVVDTVLRRETVVVYAGGFSLFFRFTAIFTKSVRSLFVGNVVTFELMVKIDCDPSVCGGPILSYTARQSFYISTYSSLRIIIGTRTFDTGLRVQVKRWNQVTVTFWSLRLEMSVCLNYAEGALLCMTFKVGTNPFIEGGILAIGTWLPSPDGRLAVVAATTFRGEIDEFRIWDRAFDYAFLQQHWLANIGPATLGLTGLWKFNEGSGRIVKDLVGSNHLYFPDKPWNTPVWSYSDLRIPYNPVTMPLRKNGTIWLQANATCTGQFWSGPLYTSCVDLGIFALRVYFDMCVEAVVDTGRNTSAIESVLLFSDYCMKTLRLSHWPAQTLCNNFPGELFPYWIGIKCHIRCVFGTKDANDTEHCKCNTGYWGTECNETCPGGAKDPCSNHGTCDPVSGFCGCDFTWKGNHNCSKCTPGWTGGDCSVAISKVTVSSEGLHLSGTFGLSHFTALDGRSFILNVVGEYFLFYSIHVHFFIQVRLVPCNLYYSCINSIAFRTSSHGLVLHGPYTTAGHPVVWLDGAIVDIDLHAITIASYGFVLLKRSETLYVFKYSSLKLSIRVHGRHLGLTPTVSGVLCENSYGILGSCNRHFLQSFKPAFPLSNCTTENQLPNATRASRTKTESDSAVNSNGANFTEETIKNLVANLRVFECASLFVYRYRHYREYRGANAGYSLHFASTAVVSSYIVEPFLNNDITIEFFLKITKLGVILCYTKEKTFVLTNHPGYFQVYYGDREFPTNITVEINQWSQIALVFRKLTGILQIYHFDHRGHLTRQDVFIGQDVFPPGGILALGAWQPSIDGSGEQLREYFTGDIDDLRVWTMAYHPAVVYQSWLKRVEVNTEQLVRLWKFDQGDGLVAAELVTGSQLSLETVPWRSATWEYSELHLEPSLAGASNSTVASNETFAKIADSFCSQVIRNGPLGSACKPLGPGTSGYYFRACVTQAISNLDVYASLEVVITYADYCESLLSLPTWPARLLCNSFPGKRFPVWTGARCDIKCFNRNYNALPRACVCRRGYWGKECGNVCPGGTVRPCNNHGVCDVTTGACRCIENWRGSLDCGTCAANWKGKDCGFAIVGITSVRINIMAVISVAAHFVTFDGTAFGLATVGDLYLLKTGINIDNDFFIQVRHAPCQSQSVCTVAAAIQLSTTVIVFHAPIIELEVPLIWANGVKITLNANATLFGVDNATITITLDAPSSYTISHVGVFSLSVRVVGTALSLGVRVNKPHCAGNTFGILGNCDGIPGNDLFPNATMANLGNVSQRVLNEQLLRVWEVGPGESLFGVLKEAYRRTSLQSGARYACMVTIFINIIYVAPAKTFLYLGH